MFKNAIRIFDMYGEPVKINYKGKETYQTIPGGILSISLIILMILFAGIKAKRLFMKEDWNINQ